MEQREWMWEGGKEKGGIRENMSKHIYADMKITLWNPGLCTINMHNENKDKQKNNVIAMKWKEQLEAISEERRM